MRNAVAQHRPFIILMLLLVGVLCCLPSGALISLRLVFPPNTPDPQEIAVRNELAAKLGVASDWGAIHAYVSRTYIPLGLTQAEVHARLASLGAFTVSREEHYYLDRVDQEVDDELIVFANPYLQQGLGQRRYVYESYTELLIESHVILPSGETARLLPTPPGQ